MIRRSVVTACLLATGTLGAQSSTQELPPGSRIRVELRDSLRQAPFAPRAQRVIAVVAHVAGDTIHALVPGTTGAVVMPRSSLRSLSISRGVPGRVESAWRQGGALAIGLGIAFLAMRSNDDSPDFRSGGEAAAVGAGMGFAIGATLGAISPSERWKRVSLRR